MGEMPAKSDLMRKAITPEQEGLILEAFQAGDRHAVAAILEMARERADAAERAGYSEAALSLLGLIADIEARGEG